MDSRRIENILAMIVTPSSRITVGGRYQPRLESAALEHHLDVGSEVELLSDDKILTYLGAAFLITELSLMILLTSVGVMASLPP